jgi:hypothetical protein
MRVPCGTWLVSLTQPDNANVLRASTLDDSGTPWGTLMGTAYLPNLEIRLRDADALLMTLPGVWEDAAQSAALFAIAAEASLVPATAGGFIDYDAVVMMDNGLQPIRFGDGAHGDVIGFRLQRWP